MIKNNSIQTETTRMKCLAYAPGMVFLLVASADNKIDQKELKRFATLMAHKDYAILASMLEQSGACVAHLLREILTDNLDPYKELQSACALLDVYLSTQAAQTYKLTLLRLARGIAKPSGRLTGFFNNKMTQEQRTSIAVVANLLGLHDKTGQQNVNREAVDVQKNGHANYSLTKDLPDTLFPALKTSDWATSTNADSLTRELYRNDGQSQANPVIAYAIDKPEIVDFISSDSVHESLSVEQIHDKAMQNLENRLLRQAEWKTLDFDSGEKNIGHISG
ncbi:MAG TPA: hypothetical protein ENJ32_06815, partial [Crenotrichaceae bacterium]|nr:hypothetical protein [Crenotrichaceae bacterium]